MFELALKANVPIIGIQTDDPVNLTRVLKHLSGLPVSKYEKPYPKSFSGTTLYWTDYAGCLSAELYAILANSKTTLVLVTSEHHPLVFDAGVLPTPEMMVKALLANMIGSTWVEEFFPIMRGLSLKTIWEVLKITQARMGDDKPITVQEVRRTRASLFGATQGLYLEDTSYDFYVWPDELKGWLELNAPYFLKDVNAKLIPRGIMFEGPPGVGKSMAAKVIANHLKVPLYRFDIASTLDKYIGVSESRVASILSRVDREAPCVLLLDEVEKIFAGKEDTGVITRLLSQLLWWLQEHQSRVFTVMTTNDKEGIPPELYRKGRIDAVMKIARLNMAEARDFAIKVYESVKGEKPSLGQMKHMQTAMIQTELGVFAHADVCEIVYTLMKQHQWC